MTPDKSEAASADLIVQGMTCASCVRRVERALRAVPGVHDATVDYATSQARVTFDPRAANTNVLVDAIDAAGYESPRPQDADGTADIGIIGMTCAACVRRIEKALRAVSGVREA